MIRAHLLTTLLFGTLALPSAQAASDRPYQAQWIWCQVASPEPFQFARFRKTIDVASCPKIATVYITADTFYRLWINGQLVMHGPARSSRGKATVDAVDVGRHLAQGRNTLMIEVFHGVCPFEALAQAPGLLCESTRRRVCGRLSRSRDADRAEGRVGRTVRVVPPAAHGAPDRRPVRREESSGSDESGPGRCRPAGRGGRNFLRPRTGIRGIHRV